MAQEHIKKPIDVWLLTGFLGAGKTTALNCLLRSPIFADRKIVLVINEFGKIGVDGQLVEPGAYSKYEINKGSLFCICTKTDFLRIFQEIRLLGPEVVLIEATGISETSDLEQLLCESVLQDVFIIRANLCIVDGVNFIKTAAFLKAAVSQVRWADGLVINKTDLLSDQEVKQVTGILRELNPSAGILPVQFGNIDSRFLKTLSHQSHNLPLLSCPPQEIPAISITTDRPVNKESFYQTMESLKTHILRFKGDVGFQDGSCFVEMAGDRVTEKPSRGTFETRTAFTVIGWKIEKRQLRDAFEKCIVGEKIEISEQTNSGDEHGRLTGVSKRGD
jgi:G3E family GTPase